MNHKILTKILSLLLITLFTSCESMLEKEYDVQIGKDEILNNADLMTGLQSNIYYYLPRNNGSSFNCISSAMLDCATDDGMESSNTSTIHKMTNGAWSPFNVVDDQWSRLYMGIRKCQTFFYYVAQTNVIANDTILGNDGKPTDQSLLRNRLIGETYFLQALFYFELIKRYGDVPMVTKMLNPELTELDIPRTPYSQIVDSIVAWCDKAALSLPIQYSDASKGRANKGAALMLKSRTLLYAASALNNPSNEISKWVLAAKAAKDVIDLSENNGNAYTLNTVFDAPFFTVYDKEIILASAYVKRSDIEFMNTPNGYSRGQGHTNPTQNLVDAYEIKANGVYVPYDPTNPAHEAKMYSVDRDPRLVGTVLYNGASFKTRNVETFVGGLDGLNKTIDYTKTGYYLKKFVNPTINLDENGTSLRAWILFRYAEALLNYAEAQNEALGSPDASVYQRLNQVRVRSMGTAGNLDPSLGWTQDQMRQRIRNERRVEFAFEEHRFWDLRRWDVATDVLSKPIYGMRISNGTASATKTRFKVEDRVFESKMNLCPISQNDALKAPTTGQTKGW
jgi:starch-binding outer membrane protein, SusD/RagB family